MILLLLCAQIFMICVMNICLKEFNKRFMKSSASYYAYNIAVQLVSIIVLLAGGPLEAIHTETAIFAAIYGVLYVFTFLLLAKAFETGPFAYTNLLYSFNVVVPALFGVALWSERPGLMQVVGFVFLALSFCLCALSDEGGEPGGGRANGKWLFFCVVAVLGSGFMQTIGKAQQMLLPGENIREMSIIAFAVSIATSAIMLIVRRHDGISHLRSRLVAFYAVLSGVFVAFTTFIQFYLSGVIPATVQFPVVNGGVVLGAAATAVILYKERPGLKRILGFATGAAGVVLLCM